MTDKEQNRSEVHQEPTSKDITGMNLRGKDRRRFIKRAIIAAPFILTVTSQPVWACNCTLSGQLSGNISPADGPPCQACTPGFWKKGNWPKYLRKDEFNFVFEVSESFFTQGNCTTLDDVIHIEWKPLDERNPDLEVFGFHAVAALLNAVAASYGVLNFGYTEGQIKDMVREALSAGNYSAVAVDLRDINEMGECPFPDWIEF